MAAVIRPQSIRAESIRAESTLPNAPLSRRPESAHRPVRQSHPGGVARPSLRLIEGGRSPQALAQHQRYQRRRAVAVVVALVLGLLVLRGAAVVVTGLAAGTAGPGSTAVATTTHRASAGDTLWEIAGRYAPQVDRRVAMDDLLAINGGAAIQVGQEVLLPASWF
jgi:nucleoid-associated protein YgaU